METEARQRQGRDRSEGVWRTLGSRLALAIRARIQDGIQNPELSSAVLKGKPQNRFRSLLGWLRKQGSGWWHLKGGHNPEAAPALAPPCWARSFPLRAGPSRTRPGAARVPRVLESSPHQTLGAPKGIAGLRSIWFNLLSLCKFAGAD